MKRFMTIELEKDALCNVQGIAQYPDELNSV